MVLALSWIGGSDTEKFMFWAMPVIYLLIGLGIQSNPQVFQSRLLVLLLAASTICSMRWFWVVPDYPNSFATPYPILSILSNHFQYLDLWSFFAERTRRDPFPGGISPLGRRHRAVDQAARNQPAFAHPGIDAAS